MSIPPLPPSPFDRPPPRSFYDALLDAARVTVGVRETSRNSGPEIDEYLASVNLRPGDPWCVAWVFYVHGKARPAGHINPCPRTGGVSKLWTLAPPGCVEMSPAPGRVFVLDKGKGLGHVGIVEEVHEDGTITSIEGNTNAAGSREGDSVARHRWNPRSGKRGVLRGYLDFGRRISDERVA